MSDFGHKIRAFRERRNLTQQEFANKCGWSATYVSLVENGKVRPPQDFIVDMQNAFPAMTKEEWHDLLKSKATAMKEIYPMVASA